MTTDQPQTWLGNIQRAAIKAARRCAKSAEAAVSELTDTCPNPEKQPGRAGYGYCNGCGRPHGPGECLRGER